MAARPLATGIFELEKNGRKNSPRGNEVNPKS